MSHTKKTVQWDDRRKIGRITHDERGNASIEWQYAETDEKRTVLEIADDMSGGLSLAKNEDTFDPYSRVPPVKSKDGPATSARKDLRKLSEWIKLMRDIEAKKQSGEG